MTPLYKKYIWLAVFIVICLLVGFLSYRTFVFQVISTVPGNGGEVSSSTGSLITIEYNKELMLNNNNLLITANDDIVTNYKIDRNKLFIQIRNLTFDKSYELYIKNVTATDSSKINSYTFKFTNKYKNYSELPKEEQQKQLEQTDKGTRDDPVTRALPITTDQYYISYEVYSTPDEKGKNEKIIIALLVTNDQQSNLQLIKNYKTQAVNFLISKGINPDDYVVEWDPQVAKDL